jgi:hypothetical protein
VRDPMTSHPRCHGKRREAYGDFVDACAPFPPPSLPRQRPTLSASLIVPGTYRD